MLIAARFNGPPGSGNGGYSAGLVAGALGQATVTVTLRRPPPLEIPLEFRATEDGASVYDGDDLVATASVATDLDPPPAPVSPAVARAAARDYQGFVEHPFPTCYVCGPDRTDGLAIFPGPLPDAGTAAPWTVPDDVTFATVWAALDCPGGWAIIAPGRPYVLGRMTATVTDIPAPADECVVVGRLVAVHGRKGQVRSAVYSATGMLLAQAASTWISIEP